MKKTTNIWLIGINGVSLFFLSWICATRLPNSEIGLWYLLISIVFGTGGTFLMIAFYSMLVALIDEE
jgi:hypothetical protein